MWTLSLTPGMWIVAAVAVFISGKMLQQGGVRYGRGQPWHFDTLSGAVVELAVLGGVAFALITQNSPQ